MGALKLGAGFQIDKLRNLINSKMLGDGMEVITAAVHFINKKVHKEIVSIEEADQEIAQSKQLSELVDEILNTYNTRCAQQAGVFQADQVNYPLSAQAAKLLLEKDKLSLLEVSISVLGRIQQLMNTQLASTGGHLLFVHYRRNDDDFLLIVKLQTVKGQIFRNLTSVEDATHLSVDTLQVAARINLSSWQEQRGERYVTFVSKREQGHTSNYFRDFIGCDVQADNRAESKKLATVIDDFVKTKVDDGELSEDEGITRMRHVFDHAENVRKKRENMSLADVASLVWPSDIRLVPLGAWRCTRRSDAFNHLRVFSGSAFRTSTSASNTGMPSSDPYEL